MGMGLKEWDLQTMRMEMGMESEKLYGKGLVTYTYTFLQFVRWDCSDLQIMMMEIVMEPNLQIMAMRLTELDLQLMWMEL